MSTKLYLHLDSSYDELENLSEIKITQTLNDHGYLYLTAIIQEQAKAKYAVEVKPYEVVELVTGNAEGFVPLFRGVVRKLQVKQIKGQYYLFVEAATGTYKADVEVRSRSFQNPAMTYKEMLTQVIGGYAGGEIADWSTNGAVKENLIVQYMETDWQFIKRMASHFHAALIPSLIHSVPKIILGKPPGTGYGEIEKYNFTIEKDLEKYLKSSSNENPGLMTLDTVIFHLELYENFEIGDSFTYYDKAGDNTYVALYIKSKEIEMIEGTLRFRYALCTKNGLSSDKLYNTNLTGLSLKGRVLKSVQDRIKVHLEIDESQDEATAWKFPYGTPYTAEGSGGWYVMPEVGDTALIYFPNREEHNAIGISCIRQQNSGSDKIGTPEVKYLRTAHGKEIKLAPNELVITCSNWTNKETGEQNKIYMQMNDSGGITIQSTKPIFINSDADINFTADKKITISAEDEIKLRCMSSVITMSSGIEVVGSPVKVN